MRVPRVPGEFRRVPGTQYTTQNSLSPGIKFRVPIIPEIRFVEQLFGGHSGGKNLRLLETGRLADSMGEVNVLEKLIQTSGSMPYRVGRHS